MGRLGKRRYSARYWYRGDEEGLRGKRAWEEEKGGDWEGKEVKKTGDTRNGEKSIWKRDKPE